MAFVFVGCNSEYISTERGAGMPLKLDNQGEKEVVFMWYADKSYGEFETGIRLDFPKPNTRGVGLCRPGRGTRIECYETTTFIIPKGTKVYLE